jgi:menaquinone-9 beta-reductase
VTRPEDSAHACDVLVIGAGLAGVAAALTVIDALPASRVLLVERAAWPRDKVCGCCLNAAGIAVLRSLGVADEIRRAAAPLHAVRLRAGDSQVRIEHSGGWSLDRRTLDAMLVTRAVERGVDFWPASAARVLDRRADAWRVRVARTEGSILVTPRVMLVADGLGGSALADHARFTPRVSPRSRMGLGGTLESVDAGASALASIAPGEIVMHAASAGYVGLVRLPTGSTPTAPPRLALAAALDPQFVRHHGPAGAVEAILSSCGVNLALSATLPLKGTALLTRRRSLLGEANLLIIGDAAGYVEPFTGEGMTWALASGRQAGRLAAEAIAGERPIADLAPAWHQWHRRRIRPRQQLCGVVRAIAHRPVATRVLVRLASAVDPVRQVMQLMANQLVRPYAEHVAP